MDCKKEKPAGQQTETETFGKLLQKVSATCHNHNIKSAQQVVGGGEKRQLYILYIYNTLL